MKTLEKQRTEPPNLEQVVQETNYRQRDNALKELLAGIARILQPRGGYHSYAGSPNRHFLDIPPAPRVRLTKTGKADVQSIDEGEQEAFQAQLSAITIEEKRLTDAAGKAKNQVEALRSWGIRIGEAEDM